METDAKCEQLSPIESELRGLKYEIRHHTDQLKFTNEKLRIARAKLAAVKRLVK